MLASDVDSIVAAAREHPRTALGQPVVVALDGRSGVGKSTLAAILIKRLGAVVVAGDDFYRVMDEGTRWALDPAGGSRATSIGPVFATRRWQCSALVEQQRS